MKTKISPKCILLFKKRYYCLLVPVYSVFPVFEMGIGAHHFKISDVCQTTFDVKKYLRFYVEYIFLKILYQILYSCGVYKHRQNFMYSGNPHGISYKCVYAQEFSWLFTKMDPHEIQYSPTHCIPILYSSGVYKHGQNLCTQEIHMV